MQKALTLWLTTLQADVVADTLVVLGHSDLGSFQRTVTIAVDVRTMERHGDFDGHAYGEKT